MQPLSPEEEQIRSAERAKRRQKREEKRAYKKGVAFLSPLVTNNEKFDRECVCDWYNNDLIFTLVFKLFLKGTKFLCSLMLSSTTLFKCLLTV